MSRTCHDCVHACVDWLQVTGNVTVVSVEGRLVYANATVAGTFNSSDPMFANTHRIVLESHKANFGSVWMDCPHRYTACSPRSCVLVTWCWPSAVPCVAPCTCVCWCLLPPMTPRRAGVLARLLYLFCFLAAFEHLRCGSVCWSLHPWLVFLSLLRLLLCVWFRVETGRSSGGWRLVTC